MTGKDLMPQEIEARVLQVIVLQVQNNEQGKFACIGKVFRQKNNGVFLSFELKEGDCMYNRNEVVMY